MVDESTYNFFLQNWKPLLVVFGPLFAYVIGVYIRDHREDKLAEQNPYRLQPDTQDKAPAPHRPQEKARNIVVPPTAPHQ